MAIEITKDARIASQKTNIDFQLILEVDGVSTKFGAVLIKKRALIGDDLTIGDEWIIGGLIEEDDQQDIISMNSGTSTSIRQQLDPSKGAGSSISSMQISLADVQGIATGLVSPGVMVEDLLGRRAKVHMGFENTAFPEDFITIFRGIIDDIQAKPGSVLLNLAHPDQKKRQTLFPPVTVTTVTDKTAADTIFAFSNFTQILNQRHMDAGEPGLVTYARFTNHEGDTEIMEVLRPILDTPNGGYFVARGQLGTTALALEIQEDEDENPVPVEVEIFYGLRGNVMDLALWLMLSGTDGDYQSYASEPVTSFVFVNPDESFPNVAFFRDQDLYEKHGVTAGDLFYTSNAINSANQYSNYAFPLGIARVEKRFDGTLLYLEDIDGGYGPDLNFVTELDSTATAYFVSRCHKFPAGAGLGMKPDEVDVTEHERIKRIFLSSFEVDLFITEETNVRELIEQQLYAVAGAYSLPRKSRSSVGMHIGPIPGTQAAIININDITNPDQLVVRRSLANNFANTVIYKYDYDLEDEPKNYIVTYNADSAARIKVGTRAMTIEARGLRSHLNGKNLAEAASERRLNRYKFAAEYIENLGVSFKKGFRMEIGDIFLLDGKGLNLLNSKDGNRNAPPKLYEIINKTLDLRTGAVSLSVVDTSYSTQNRYGLISPSSRIKTGLSQTKFVIEQWQPNSIYGSQEAQKWTRFMENSETVAIKVRSQDFTTRFFETTVKAIRGNEIEVNDPLGFVPQPGDFMELADYDFEGTTETIKKLYAFMRDADFDDGTAQYLMI